MKRILCILMILALIFCGFTGCKKPKEENVFEIYNRMVESTDSYKLEVKTETNGETLVSTYEVDYTVTGYTVKYSCESMTVIDLANPADDYKTVKTGEAVIEGGKVVSQTGDTADALPGRLALSFDKSFFSNFVSSDGSLIAKVSDVSGFMGIVKNASDMTAEVTYSAESFTRILITYKTGKSSVTMTYTFD